MVMMTMEMMMMKAKRTSKRRKNWRRWILAVMGLCRVMG